MATPTKLGGKSSGGRRLPAAALIIIGKPSSKPPDSPTPPPSEPDDDDVPGSPPPVPDNDDDDSGAPVLGTANFHDQRQLCSNCNYFDSNGADGLGECLKQVPEADFSIADPDASHCRFWEARNQRQADSAGTTGVRTADNLPPNPPPDIPPAA